LLEDEDRQHNTVVSNRTNTSYSPTQPTQKKTHASTTFTNQTPDGNGSLFFEQYFVGTFSDIILLV
jgi:hypothetical protein